jgi:hypothetical protein
MNQKEINRIMLKIKKETIKEMSLVIRRMSVRFKNLLDEGVNVSDAYGTAYYEEWQRLKNQDKK